jgi:hypothetical protein
MKALDLSDPNSQAVYSAYEDLVQNLRQTAVELQ